MINKFAIQNLRNAVHYQFISSTCGIFAKFDIDRENLGVFYDALGEHLKAAEVALSIEKKNEKVREKNEMDRYRDRLHSKFFNHLKSILYDEKDIRFDDAQQVMRVVKDVGNPTRLAENAESAMLTALGNRLEPYRNRLEAIGAQPMVDALLEANRQFIALEIECREITAEQQLNKAPSMATVRKQADPVYRAIVSVINGYAGIPSKKEVYRELVTEMNVLVAKYDALLMGRKSSKKDDQAQPTGKIEGEPAS